MKKTTLVILFFATACSHKLRVYTEHDHNVNLRQYTSFDWLSEDQYKSEENTLYYNEANDSRIKRAIKEQLTARGYVHVAENPGLIVHYHIVVENKTMMRTDPYGDYGPHWLMANINEYEYGEGTLIIDLIDAETCNLAWRGWAVSALHSEKNDSIQEETIRNTIYEILNKFPSRTVK